MRVVMFALAVLAALALAVFVTFYVMIIRPVESALAPATPENARVQMLAGAPDAVIVMPFVTGDVPRLIAGAALDRHRAALWYTDTTDAGNIIGAVVLGTMGMAPSQAIGTSFRAGIPQQSFDCLSVGCINWPTDGAAIWGLGALRGMGDALGPEVVFHRETHDDFATYLAAYRAVEADPSQWFSRPQDLQPLPGDDGLRLMVIRLPDEVLVHAPVFGANDEDPAREAELTRLAGQLVADTGGQVEAVLNTAPMPLWALKDGMTMFDADGAMRALPDLTFRGPVLRLKVPADKVAVVRARLDATALPGPDLAMVDTALRAAYAGWGEDPACLPGCGGVAAGGWQTTPEISLGGTPFWTLDYWQTPPSGR